MPLSLADRARRVRVAARSVGLRQDDDAADDRGVRRAHVGRGHASNGRDLLAVPAAKRGLGIVFQNYALFPHMTVARERRVRSRDARTSRSARARRSASPRRWRSSASTGLSERHPAQLSGGQQQRVALARALVIRPDLLLLDEPLSNLDAKLREEMQVELRRIQRAVGITTLMVTHDQAEALALSDRVVVMHAGRIEQDASPLAAYEHPAHGFRLRFPRQGEPVHHRARSTAATWRSRAAAVLRAAGRRGGDARAGDRCWCGPKRSRSARQAPIGARRRRSPSRVFQGNHWLYQLDTPLGPALVIRQNDGGACPARATTCTSSGGRTTCAPSRQTRSRCATA